MDAVQELVEEYPTRDITMELIAKHAGVGKPTLYKWWTNKARLILAMFGERLHGRREDVAAPTIEGVLRNRVKRLIREFNGSTGKAMAGLIAEGQSDPRVLSELYERHVSPSRRDTVAEIREGMSVGELSSDIDPELLADMVFGAIYFRLLLRSAPLTEEYGERLVDQALRIERVDL